MKSLYTFCAVAFASALSCAQPQHAALQYFPGPSHLYRWDVPHTDDPCFSRLFTQIHLSLTLQCSPLGMFVGPRGVFRTDDGGPVIAYSFDQP